MAATAAVLLAPLLVGTVLAPGLGATAATSPAASAQQAPPQRPVFKDGEAQPVFDPKNVVREELFVRAPVDSDRDGADDEVHVVVVRPAETKRGVRVPVVYQASPYYAGGNDVANHDVDVELHDPGAPDDRATNGTGTTLRAAEDQRRVAAAGARAPRADIGSSYEEYFLARGFAMVYAESLGTGESTGCPTTGGRNETIGARSVIDWLGGRASARDSTGKKVKANWTTGKTGMMGVSYNGTLPNAVASTGVPGLEAIVPIAAISSWYDYYRADGAVVAPGGFQGEDADVLAKYVHTRADRAVCQPVIDELAAEQDRSTGDYSEFWDERNYLNDVDKVRAGVLAVHGLNDWNVKTKQAAQWYEALADNGVDRKIWLHQGAHVDPASVRPKEWHRTLNRWFSHFLYGLDNGVTDEPKATLQRADESWVDEPDWPSVQAQDARVYPWPGGTGRGALDPRFGVPGSPSVERLADDATQTVDELVDLARSGNRLSYVSAPARSDLRLSGTPRARLRIAFDRPAANVTAVLVDRAPDGSSKIITRGWTDPQNRDGADRTEPIEPGESYDLSVELQPQDYVLPKGNRLEFALVSSDHDYTLRPKPGAGLAMTLNASNVTLPVVGGPAALRNAIQR
ncbi:Xaa-Pro dipeptidyl-peptidase [Tamaricihabitans halophyticus]|nr:Xaa-Pro dipeptidyl-peptidase [Tamaricihabitans halophyticus]